MDENLVPPPSTIPVVAPDRLAPAPPTDDPAPAAPAYVYALGQIQPRFPTLGVEKEFAQVAGRLDAAGLTDGELLHAVMADDANRYLVRQLCWVFLIEGIETYLIAPRDPVDLGLLVDAARPRPDVSDLDLVIGLLGPVSAPDMCGGLSLPIVAFDQVYSFDRATLLGAIPRPARLAAKDEDRFSASAGELLDRILQLADNAGATDDHRALNYLGVRYPEIYARTAAANDENASLVAVNVLPSRLSTTRVVRDVVFAYRHRQTGVVDQFFARVDVSEEFPFLVTPLSPYYDRP